FLKYILPTPEWAFAANEKRRPSPAAARVPGRDEARSAAASSPQTRYFLKPPSLSSSLWRFHILAARTFSSSGGSGRITGPCSRLGRITVASQLVVTVPRWL